MLKKNFCKIWVFLLTILGLLSIGNVYAETDYDELIEEKEEEKEAKEEKLKESEQLEYTYLQEGLSLSEKIKAVENDVAGVEDAVSESENKQKRLQKELKQKKEDLKTKQENFQEESQDLYKLSQISVVQMILSSDGLASIGYQVNMYRFRISRLIQQLEDIEMEMKNISAKSDELSKEIEDLDAQISELGTNKEFLLNQKKAYEIRAAEEAAKQQQLVGQIENITEEQQQLIKEKMEATEESGTVGEYGHVEVDVPAAPFDNAFAVASIGYPHRVGLNQYGAYGRSKAGQSYGQILNAYYNADLSQDSNLMDKIYVEGHGELDFEEEYMMGIAEMPTYWADSGGFEALKAQAIASRSYAVSVTRNGQYPICASQSCQVFNPDKVTSSQAEQWHKAVEETQGEVLKYNNSVISAYYASTAGGYTRLTSDFDVGWGSSAPGYLKRVVDKDDSGKAFDGPEYGNSPWYYKFWYAQSDVHPWLTQEEMTDLLNAALLSESYNQYLSHPDHGGWNYDKVRSELEKQGISPINDVSSVTPVNNNSGYTQTLTVVTSEGTRSVDGVRFGQVFKLRSRGYLALWSSLYDVKED